MKKTTPRIVPLGMVRPPAGQKDGVPNWPQAAPQQTWARTGMLILTGGALALWAGGYVLGSPRLHGMALALTGVVLHYWAYQMTAKWMPQDFGGRFVIFGSGFSALGLFFAFLIGSDSNVNGFPCNIISTRPIMALIGWMALPAGVLAYAWLDANFRGGGRPSRMESMASLFDKAPRGIEVMLIVGCVVTFLSWFVTRAIDENSLFAYLVRILMRVCTFVPFAAGYYWDRFRTALIVCAVTFVAGLYFAFLTGSRGYVFLPLLLFFIGVLMRQAFKRRLLRSLVLLAPMGLVLVGFGGAIGILRDQVGRSDVGASGQVSAERRKDIIRDVLESGGADSGSMGAIENIAFRLVPWPNLTVPVMSPSDVEYRGFGDSLEELVAAFSVARFSGLVYSVNFHSNRYGFYTGESSSVEFGVIADAWSRGGVLASLAYAAIGTFLLVQMERGIKRIAGPNVIWHIAAVLMVFSVAWFDYGRTGLIYAYRGAVISAVILVALIFIHRLFSRRNHA